MKLPNSSIYQNVVFRKLTGKLILSEDDLTFQSDPLPANTKSDEKKNGKNNDKQDDKKDGKATTPSPQTKKPITWHMDWDQLKKVTANVTTSPVALLKLTLRQKNSATFKFSNRQILEQVRKDLVQKWKSSVQQDQSMRNTDEDFSESHRQYYEEDELQFQQVPSLNIAGGGRSPSFKKRNQQQPPSINKPAKRLSTVTEASGEFRPSVNNLLVASARNNSHKIMLPKKNLQTGTLEGHYLLDFQHFEATQQLLVQVQNLEGDREGLPQFVSLQSPQLQQPQFGGREGTLKDIGNPQSPQQPVVEYAIQMGGMRITKRTATWLASLCICFICLLLIGGTVVAVLYFTGTIWNDNADSAKDSDAASGSIFEDDFYAGYYDRENNNGSS